MERVLVLGANGFIGRKLTDRLLEEHYVVGYDAKPVEREMDTRNYFHICGNYVEETAFSEIIKKHEITVIYHMISTSAPKDGTAHIEQELKENVFATVRLLEAAASCKVKKVIFPSSGGTVYGESLGEPHREDEALMPECSYGAQKAAIEGLFSVFHCMHGLEYQIARIGNPYGVCKQQGRTQGIIPLFIKFMNEGQGITVFGNTIRDYVYIDDVVEALIHLMHYQGTERIFNISSGVGVSLQEIIERIEQAAGRKFSAIAYQERRKCDVQESVLNIDKAKELLGWSPKVSLEEGIAQTIQQMQEGV